jgi:signal transduction histidine kinase
MRLFTTAYLLLLIYIIAALLFWGHSLNQHSQRLYEQDVVLLHYQLDSMRNPHLYDVARDRLAERRATRTKQYLGEGITFLVVILVGAGVVYTSFRRSIRLSRQQNNFMLSVTHELKSPIAAMKLNLQTLKRHQLTEAQQDQLRDRCLAEANRLNDLCNNMLLASQIEGRQYKATTEDIDLSDLVEQSVEDYAIRYPQRFDEDVRPGCHLRGDRLLLQMAINNLLENAVKYTPSDAPVHVRLFRRKNDAVLQVMDEGPGVPDSEKKKIFNKFYRVGNENTRKAKGTGLGLYLTRSIVRQHKGRISVRDAESRGSIFEVCLPLSRNVNT